MDRSYERLIEELTDIAKDVSSFEESVHDMLGSSEDNSIMKAEISQIRERLNNSCRNLESLLNCE